MSWLKKAVDNLIVKPVKAITNLVVDGFNNLIVKPITNLFSGFFPDPPNIDDYDIPSTTTVDYQPAGNPIPILYGKQITGIVPIFVDVGGNNNQYLYVCGVIGLGSMGGLWRMAIDGIPVNNGVRAQGTSIDFTGSITRTNNSNQSVWEYGPRTGKFYKRLVWEYRNGQQDQPHSKLLAENSKWGTQRRLPGVAYVAMRFEWNTETITDRDGVERSNPYSNLPQVTVGVNGRMTPVLATGTDDSTDTDAVWDEVVDTYNPYGHGTLQDDKYEDTSNPAEHLFDYLINDQYGPGIDLADLDIQSFRDCTVGLSQNATINGVVYGNRSVKATSDYLYDDDKQDLINLVTTFPIGISRGFRITNATNHLENVRMMLSSMGAYMPRVNGKYKLMLENGGLSSRTMVVPTISELQSTVEKTFTDDDMIGAVQLTGASLNNRYNQVKVNFADITQDSQSNSVVYPDPDGSVYQQYLAEDNNKKLQLDVTVNGIFDSYDAAIYARVLLNKSRNAENIQFTATAGATDVHPGMLVRVNLTGLSIDNIYRVNNMVLNYDGTITFEASKHIPDNYNYTQDLVRDPRTGFRVLDTKITKQKIIKPLDRTKVSQPTNLIVDEIYDHQKQEFDDSYSVIKLRWRDNNLNSHTNSYNVYYRIYTDQDVSKVSLSGKGYTRSQEFRFVFNENLAGQLVTLEVETVDENGNKSPRTTTNIVIQKPKTLSVTNSGAYAGFFDNNIFDGTVSSGNIQFEYDPPLEGDTKIRQIGTI